MTVRPNAAVHGAGRSDERAQARTGDQTDVVTVNEQTRRYNEALLETVIAAAPVGLMFVAADLRVAKANGQALELTGLSPAHVLGVPIGVDSPGTGSTFWVRLPAAV